MEQRSSRGESRWSTRRGPGGWTLADAGLAVLFLAAVTEEIALGEDMRPRVLLMLGAAITTLPLAWRRSVPVVVAGVAVVSGAGNLLMGVVSTGPFTPQLALFPVLVALFSAGYRLRGRPAVATGSSTLLILVLAHVASVEGHADDFWPWLLWAGAFGAGTFIRRGADLAAHHARRAALLELEAQATAAESAQRERDRIARDLHDVVAHSVSLMVVQAGAERLRLGAGAGPTGGALEAIEQAGRNALSELRTMLGVLREESTGPEEPLAPLPGLFAVSSLVARLRAAGLPVELETNRSNENAPATTTAGVELAAYRIIQESLTNVVRHAGLVPTYVGLTVSEDSVYLSVRNEAAGARPTAAPTAAPGGAGRGVVGMRERAVAAGGSFVSGPDRGGYRVDAVLPVGLEPGRTG